ncbi:MAG: T9SS type A sorting domain-containing protein [Bacteroidetes bacterium]|nr:MAG: T9SS type A sorting domain-containing protein [Bacteroidota bacterium]
MRKNILNFITIILTANFIQLHSTIVTIDTNIKYQTIRGWGASSFSPEWLTEDNRKELIDVLVNDLGLNRLRLEFPSGNRSKERAWEWENDDRDPFNYNWNVFNLKSFDAKIEKFVLPFKNKVEQNGEPFDMYVSPSLFNGGSSGAAPAWLQFSPGEFSEYATSVLIRLKENYNIEPNYFCILNEAGNNNSFYATVVSDMIKTLGPRMKAMGLKTRIQFPECVSASESWNYINSTKDDSIMLSYVDVLSYHLYGSNDPFRSQIRDFAKQHGKITAQTEYMSLNMNILYDDMTKGETSYWEIYGIGSCLDLKFDRILKLPNFWNFRQVFKYVRPGAVRINASSDDSTIKVLAYFKDEMPTIVIINNSGTKSINVENLIDGDYGICRTVSGTDYKESGIKHVSDGRMTIQVVNSVTTIYPYNGSNHPPAATSWGANTDYLTLPANNITLSVMATDAENDRLAYSWSVKTKPSGANPVIQKPTDSVSVVTGLNSEGKYIFEVSISDGVNTISKEARVNVYAVNQPPKPMDVHNRIPVMITLPCDSTAIRAGSKDLENDKITYRWSIINQPAGANAFIEDTTQAGTKVRNMSIAGDYVFQINISDGINTVYDTLNVPVYPINNNAPSISNISANPSKIILPADSTLLSADVADIDGDNFTLWWSVKSCPAGAIPKFVNQATANTIVKDLDKTGTYTFTLTAIDRTKKSGKDVTVTVENPTITEETLSKQDKFNIYPNPADETLYIEFGMDNKSRIFIRDLFGRVVKSFDTESSRDGMIKWDCSDSSGNKLAPGAYHVIISNRNGIVLKSVIIQ